MAGSVTFNWVDNSGESSSSIIHLGTINAGNYAAIVDDAPGGVIGDIKAAIDDITLMNNVRRTVTCEQFTDTPSLPANAFAQRETKLLVTYADNVTARKYTFTVPGPDLSLIAQTGTDVVDHTSNIYAAALVTAFEAGAYSPLGNAVTVVGMRIVGRNV